MKFRMFYLIISILFWGVLSQSNTTSTQQNPESGIQNLTKVDRILNNPTSIQINTTQSPTRIKYQDYCYDNCDGKHQVCVDSVCQCMPQTIWNNLTNSCEAFKCKKSEECQTYDKNRFCNYGQCDCNEKTESRVEGYGFKCTSISCFSLDYNPGCQSTTHLKCINSQCECKHGYKLNYSTGRCEKIKCTSSHECREDDPNTFCDSDGTCKCKETFNWDDSFKDNFCKRKGCLTSWSFNDHSMGCSGIKQHCVDSQCVCGQDFFMNNITGKCELNSCVNSTDCLSRDENSFCSKGFCECKSNFIADNYQICSAQSCMNDMSCSDSHAFCVNGRCECEPNYRLSNETGKCELFFCKQSDECQSYDSMRLCINGTCRCEAMSVPNTKNGLKCWQKSCQNSTECSLNNTVCLDNKCGCALNFKYNQSTQECDPFVCQKSSDCGDDRICSTGQCVCPDGWKSDDSNGEKCVQSSPTYGMDCQYNNVCVDQSEKCVDSRCKCAPNFKHDQNLDKCMPFRCQNSSECTEYDANRVCTNGQCNCLENFVENQQNDGICIKKLATYGEVCSVYYDCESGLSCINRKCSCQANLIWNAFLKSCECALIDCDNPDDFHIPDVQIPDIRVDDKTNYHSHYYYAGGVVPIVCIGGYLARRRRNKVKCETEREENHHV